MIVPDPNLLLHGVRYARPVPERTHSLPRQATGECRNPECSNEFFSD